MKNRVKYLQRNWATPVLQFANLDELNQYLYQCCVNDQQRTVSGKSESIATRFAQEMSSTDKQLHTRKEGTKDEKSPKTVNT
ncbi:MAG: hypothetical protein R3C28_29325 [Pirellulaceae bacterium]